MKQKTTNLTRSKRDGRKRPPCRGTKFAYEVELFWAQHHQATVIITARSYEEAQEKAERLSSEDVDSWVTVNGEMFVNSVSLAQGGTGHE